ncbi:MAG: bifunctional riboflavin kinase/FAD synthetase [Chloroflexota bacterium]
MSQSFLRVTHLSEVTERRPTFLAIGSFDGVHLGHQSVIRSLVEKAKKAGARAAVLTFFPHPKRVVLNLKGRHYLSTLDDRVAALGALGVDLVITHPFNETVRNTKAAAFMEQLCYHLDLRELWGGDFALGYKREGTINYLQALGKEKGYTVQLVSEMVSWQGELVSSTRVRALLNEGNVAAVASCLGRPYQLRGQIVLGDQRGRTIGFPTANLAAWDEQVLPTHGVYATYAWVGNQRYKAATNIGKRPTVDGLSLRIEAHLLNFAGDLYGEELCLQFVEHIRPEQKFAGLDQLVKQIQQDVNAVETILEA